MSTSAQPKVWLSSLARVVDAAEAQINIFDRGFLYGDSVYETLRTIGGQIVELAPHLARLHHSARGIGLKFAFSDAQIQEATRETMAASGNFDMRLRIIVTRGVGPLSLDTRVAGMPLLVIIAERLVLPTSPQYETGLAIALVPASGQAYVQRGLKTGNYLANILALRQAIESGADDAIMCNPDGSVAEAVTSNVFWRDDEGLKTPSLACGVLAGITRETVLRLADQLGFPCQEVVADAEALRHAREAFLTSTIRGVIAVTKIDGQCVADGRIGPSTRALMKAYEAYLEGIADQRAER